MDPVVHFEMPYDDAERLAKFYKGAFGWKMKSLGEKMGHYMLAGTGQTNRDGMMKKPGMINGGFYPKRADVPSQPSVVIAVKDLVRSMESVTAAGGAVLGEPMDIPGIGSYVSFTDTEGNRVGMLQPAAMPRKKAASAKKRPAVKRKTKKSA
jgi:predicted enzyme related to lactoylglutathione lyase